MLIDAHCHIHETYYSLDVDEVIKRAHEADVMQMICVGTDETSSRRAIDLAEKHDGIFASIGVHPHDAKTGLGNLSDLIDLDNKKIVSIGEIGLDYFHNHSPRDAQIQILESQIELALKHNLPIIFHVRQAFDDFWPVFDSFQSAVQPIRGVLHSFTDTIENAKEGLKRGLYIGVNGYSTFVKDESQKLMFAALPINKLLLETDAPYLTPSPFRGKVNEPAYIKNIANYHASIRQISLEEVANITTANANMLFKLENR
jgi:TatD DNase family protein